MNEPFDFGATLRRLRRQKGYTQKRLSEILNVSETTISKYESNTVSPPFETVRAMAELFGVPIDLLAGNIPPRTLSLYGLTDEQADLIRETVKFLSEKNAYSGVAGSSAAGRYELLGRIVWNFFN